MWSSDGGRGWAKGKSIGGHGPDWLLRIGLTPKPTGIKLAYATADPPIKWLSIPHWEWIV